MEARVGSSFVGYRGHGFWASDGVLQVWLALLGREIESLADAPGWMTRLREHWHTEATKPGMGWIRADLDEHITDEGHAQQVIELGSRALEWLRAQGTAVPGSVLGRMFPDLPRSWPHDPPAAGFIEVGELFLALLRGEITLRMETSPTFPSTWGSAGR